MSRPSRVIVLAEDQRHVRFVRRYLYRHGHSPHDIYVEPLPNGRGCGEQFVRERYAKSVQAYRVRSKRAQTALVVAIDADTSDVARRVRQLQLALEQAELEARAEDEAIVHLVPRRNIETWILCLSGADVDEDTDYKEASQADQGIGSAAITFFEWSRANAMPPARCVPSLRAAILEVRRLG